jgi:pyridoxal phosphate enzyme (YggS family)
MSIAEHLQEISNNIARIARECGRNPDEIQLVAVSKRFPVQSIEEAIVAGQLVFGENYIQEAEAKALELDNRCTFHFIGHLQRNKAKIAARIFDVVETVDSFKLASALSKHLQELNRTMKILLQVNIGQDDNKSGIEAEEAEQLLKEISVLPNITVTGLMTMPPFTDDPELARPHFRQLSELAAQLQKQGLFPDNQKVELSMGMSNDYHVAIQEGATIIRIGTAIFGQR